MAGDSFAAKRLSFTFVLGTGEFGAGGSNTLTVSNVRASARVENAGGGAMPTASLQIFGMKQDQMNALSTLGQIATTTRRNIVTVMAGDDGKAMSQVFQGTIVNGYGDYARQPKVPFIVDAAGGFTDQLRPPPNGPTSFKGSADVATLLANLAAQFDPPLRFENNGVKVQLQNPYYAGSARSQVKQICRHAGIDWNGGENGVLAIWPPGMFRKGAVPLIAPPPKGSMIGYPAFFSQGITVKNLFNPNVVFGGVIKVESSLGDLLDRAQTVNEAAGAGGGPNGLWGVSKMSLDLEAMVPRGKWEMEIQATPVGYTIVPSST